MDGVIIRDMIPSDRNFIFKSVLQHYRYASPHNKQIPDVIYFDNHHYLIGKVMRYANNVVRVAALQDDPEIVFGFLWGNFDPETIHYVYVKKAFRRMGIARLLYESTFDKNIDLYYTHFTKEAAFLCHKYEQLIFNPYLLNGDLWRLTQPEGEADRRSARM